MCVTGKPIKAAEALAAGLIDAVIDGDLADGAVAFAQQIAAPGTCCENARPAAIASGTPDANAPLFAAARELAGKVRRRQIAPLKAVEAIEAAATLPFEEGCRRERELFFECVETRAGQGADSRVLRRARGHEAARRAGGHATAGRSNGSRSSAPARWAAGSRWRARTRASPVAINDATQEALDRGLATIRRNYESSVKRGRLTPDAVARARSPPSRPRSTTTASTEADLVIEAVFENMALKKQVVRRARWRRQAGARARDQHLDARHRRDRRRHRASGRRRRPAFLQPRERDAAGRSRARRATSPEVLGARRRVREALGKVGVVVGNCPGFVGNRMMFPYMYEAQFLVEEGATPEQVDQALTDFGMAMGIFAVDDMAGLDVAWRVRQELKQFSRAGRAPAARRRQAGRAGPPRAEDRQGLVSLRRAAEADAGSRGRRPDSRDGARRRHPAAHVHDEEIVERCIYALINEGARVLEEGFAQRASDIDVIYLNGYGFPAWRGGPMFYADRNGPARRFTTASPRSIASSASGGRRRRCSPPGRERPHVPRARSEWLTSCRPRRSSRRRADGTLYARSPVPLGRYPDKITERLEHWADRAPERTFLAQRDAAGAWQHLTYARRASAPEPSRRRCSIEDCRTSGQS